MNKHLAFAILLLMSAESFAYRGLGFQARIKDPQGHLPNASNVAVTVQILDPASSCVLREEVHNGIDIVDGHFNLNIGHPSATTAGSLNPSPVLSVPDSLNNIATKTGLKCVDANNNVVSSNQAYNPTAQDARKIRLRFEVQGNPIVADFNLRSVGYAVQAEQSDNSALLEGKNASQFIQTSLNVTQSSVESFFAQLVAGTFNANTATSAASVSGTVGLANGGTGATTASAARTNLGLGTMALESATDYAKTSTLSSQLPPTPTGHAEQYLRVNSAGTAYESRTPAQALTDLLTPVTAIIPVDKGGTGATTKAQGIKNLLPTYATNTVLATDGSDLLWVSANALLPTQSGNANKVLVTNGTNTYWSSPVSGANQEVQFNDNGIPGGSSRFKWDNTNGVLNIGGQIRHGFRDVIVADINFYQGNTHRTFVTPPATFTFTAGSLADGVEYTIILSHPGEYTLPTTSSDGITTWQCSPACPSNKLTTTNTTILKIIRAGTDGYAHWITGFQ